ncbi:MAG TPA: Maebl [Cyanobacteria bacterium UBA11049]|nr:Maebl [Cyanobacteria bacterium UBA11049]
MQGEPLSRAARLAVLIDADNADASLVEPILKEIANYGTAHLKRIYGDWSHSRLSCWKDKLLKFAIQPIQQFSYTSGKNSTDIALIIDAMDLLYTNNFDCFCIISSDSDFTRLAYRIRESGLCVYGFGEKKTPESFVKACNIFTYTEPLKNIEEKEIQCVITTLSVKEEKGANRNGQNKSGKIQVESNFDRKLLILVKNAYAAIATEDGWASIGQMGSQLHQLSSSFNCKNYGYNQLGKLIRAMDIFEFKEIPNKKAPTVKDLYIKLKV